MGSLIGTALKAVFSAIFGSLWNRFFPAQTAADQKSQDLFASLRAEHAEAEASAQAPSDKASLIEALKNNKVCLLLLILPLLTACATSVSYSCPVPRYWTTKQEDEMAANLATLPDNSPLIAMGVEWAKLRAESKACATEQ